MQDAADDVPVIDARPPDRFFSKGGSNTAQASSDSQKRSHMAPSMARSHQQIESAKLDNKLD